MQIPDTTAIWADFAHIRTVKGRKVCELIVEAPLEDLLEILKRLGNPVGADMIPVAIVPIDPNAVKAALDIKPVAKPSEAAPSGSSKPFSSLPLSQQAALRCRDKSFQEFMCREYWNTCVAEPDEAYTTRLVKDAIGFESRSALDDDRNAQAISTWSNIEERYQVYLTDQRYAGSRR